jgi:hypothetical protein
MDVGRHEHLALPSREPRGLGGAMALRTAAVPARVVRLGLVPTMVALRDMSAQGGGPTERDSPQGPMLLAREGGPIACEEGGAMLAHHVSDFEWRATHGSWSRSAGKARASRGLSVACSAG